MQQSRVAAVRRQGIQIRSPVTLPVYLIADRRHIALKAGKDIAVRPSILNSGDSIPNYWAGMARGRGASEMSILSPEQVLKGTPFQKGAFFHIRHAGAARGPPAPIPRTAES